MTKIYVSQEIGVNWRKEKGDNMNIFRCDYINAYKSMQNWRKIGVNRPSQYAETLENKAFLGGNIAL